MPLSISHWHCTQEFTISRVQTTFVILAFELTMAFGCRLVNIKPQHLKNNE